MAYAHHCGNDVNRKRYSSGVTTCLGTNRFQRVTDQMAAATSQRGGGIPPSPAYGFPVPSRSCNASVPLNSSLPLSILPSLLLLPLTSSLSDANVKVHFSAFVDFSLCCHIVNLHRDILPLEHDNDNAVKCLGTEEVVQGTMEPLHGSRSTGKQPTMSTKFE